MCFRLIFFALMLGNASCTSFKLSEQVEMYNVEIHGSVHKPYCGGAMPSPDLALGYDEPIPADSYHVFRGNNYDPKARVITHFTFNDEGKSSLKLSQGNYYLMHADKRLPIEVFMKKYGVVRNPFYVVKNTSCFVEWQNQVDLFFEVTRDTLMQWKQYSKCWTGTNPCIEYVGPDAP